jgi:hypothetical protein
MIPGFVITVLTFPGVIVHEAAHLLFCKLRGVRVFKVCYFQLGTPAGYVLHEPPESFLTTLLVCVGPFIINSLLCVVFCFPAYLPYRVFQIQDPIAMFFLWLGVSIGMHAFPSIGDGTVLWKHAVRGAKALNPLAILSMPLVLVIVAANIGSIFWLDAMYGLALGLGVPEILFKHLA